MIKLSTSGRLINNNVNNVQYFHGAADSADHIFVNKFIISRLSRSETYQNPQNNPQTGQELGGLGDGPPVRGPRPDAHLPDLLQHLPLRLVRVHHLQPGESGSDPWCLTRFTSSASKRSIRTFVITEKAPTRAFSWLKAATTAFTF